MNDVLKSATEEKPVLDWNPIALCNYSKTP
jgi:hypothetical protein